MKSKARILIVDDNKLLCKNLKDILELKGYDIACAYDGQEAIKAVKDGNFKIALMDVKMPGMSGIDALKSLRQIAPGLTVIFITAFTDDIFYKEGLKSGDFEVITKPIDIDKFLGRLEEVVKKSPAS
ncbi:MAG: response regulator [Candidatus Omnitrophica bacterium]|nr:response regulator [Candidatus Omnitrophota bacterium]